MESPQEVILWLEESALKAGWHLSKRNYVLPLTKGQAQTGSSLSRHDMTWQLSMSASLWVTICFLASEGLKASGSLVGESPPGPTQNTCQDPGSNYYLYQSFQSNVGTMNLKNIEASLFSVFFPESELIRRFGYWVGNQWESKLWMSGEPYYSIGTDSLTFTMCAWTQGIASFLCHSYRVFLCLLLNGFVLMGTQLFFTLFS